MNTVSKFGIWHNFDNYLLRSVRVSWWPIRSWHRCPCFQTTWYERDLRPWPPAGRLTWQHPDGRYVQCDQHEAETDLGTTLIAGLFYPPTEFIRAYGFLHDPVCELDEQGRHVLWISDALEGPYTATEVLKQEADEWLRLSAIAEGVAMGRPIHEVEARANSVKWAVQFFRGTTWKS